MKHFHTFNRITASVLMALLILVIPINPSATETVDYKAEAEARKLLRVESNEVAGWPQGPEIGAEAAILMEANTGAILYAKNIDERLYPASTTKILTCTLAIENSELTDTVTFSREAVNSVPWDGSKIGMDAGNELTMEQCLEAILIGSANEVANAVAEHVGGSMDGFVEMMNKRVDELGLKNTHFVNANGLYDDQHYTSAYDLAIIARDFFSYEILAKIARTPTVDFTPTDKQPDEFTVYSKNMLLNGKKYEYEYLVGSKTGYTDKARQTLVSCARKDGMELICVILKEESPNQFTDTVSLFEYGFNNFKIEKVGNNELSFDTGDTGFFQTGTDIFGDSKNLLYLDREALILLPKDSEFTDLTMNVIYDSDNVNAVARAEYSFNGVVVGLADIMVSADGTTIFDDAPSDTTPTSDEAETSAPVTNLDDKSVFVNIKIVLICLLGFVIIVSAVLIVINKIKMEKRKLKRKKPRKKGKKNDNIYRSDNREHHHNFTL